MKISFVLPDEITVQYHSALPTEQPDIIIKRTVHHCHAADISRGEYEFEIYIEQAENDKMSRVVRKSAFAYICENKDADQLRGNREADQRLCFRCMDSTIPLLPKSEISSHWPSCVAVQPGLCGTWSKTPKTGFLTTRLKYYAC